MFQVATPESFSPQTPHTSPQTLASLHTVNGWRLQRLGIRRDRGLRLDIRFFVFCYQHWLRQTSRG